MESSALRKRAAWLHAVATHLPARDVAMMLDGYAEDMIAAAEHAERRHRAAGFATPQLRH